MTECIEPLPQAGRSAGAEGKPLRILWTLPYLPWPTTSGGKLRQYHLLRTLSQRGHRITLLVQSKEPLTEATRQRLSQVVEHLIVLPRRPLKHWRTLLAAAFAPYPLLVSVNGLSPALERRFSDLLNESWDVVQIEHSYGLQPYLDLLQQGRRPFLLTEHNLESSLGAATYQHLPWWVVPYVLYDQWRYRRWEKRAFQAASCIAAVTADDARRMEKVGQRPVDVVINGVDTRAFAAVRPDVGSRRILFVGNFEYPPNLDAVRWCVEEILPLVWQAVPDARFAVCGYAMPTSWPRRWTDPRIEWVGYVPELTVEQQASAAFLAALREGGGSKLKVLEAMAAGLPVVSTRQGVSGLQVEPGVSCACDDEAAGLAQALVALLSDPEAARQMGEAGRRYVCAQHDWTVAAGQLEQLYQKVTDAHRH